MTLSTSAIDRSCATLALRDLLATALIGVFGMVYEHFGHGVYSAFMACAFLIPLLGGALPCLVHALHGRRPWPVWAVRLHHWGLATLTVGSLFQGVLEIYGTTNRLVLVYLIVGCVLLALAWTCRSRTEASACKP